MSPFKSIKLRFTQSKMEIYHISLIFENVAIPYSLAPVMRTCKLISTIVSHTSLGICFKSRPTSLSTSKESAAITHPNLNPAYPAYSNHDCGNRYLNRVHSKQQLDHTHSSATEHFYEKHQTLLKSGTVLSTCQVFFWQSERLSYTHSTELFLIGKHPLLQPATARQLQPQHRCQNDSPLVKVHYLSRYNLHQYTNQIVLRPTNSFILSHSVYAKLAGAALI